MTVAVRLDALGFGTEDPERLARFWAGLLDRELDRGSSGEPIALAPDEQQFRLRFYRSTTDRRRVNQMPLDLTTPSADDMDAMVALELGGRRHDIGQGPEITHVVLAEPEGSEFCVLPPGNAFLEDCPRVAALSGDGSRDVGG